MVFQSEQLVYILYIFKFFYSFNISQNAVKFLFIDLLQIFFTSLNILINVHGLIFRIYSSSNFGTFYAPNAEMHLERIIMFSRFKTKIS